MKEIRRGHKFEYDAMRKKKSVKGKKVLGSGMQRKTEPKEKKG